MYKNKPTRLTLVDAPRGRIDWNMSDNNMLLVTGGAGAGKTTLLTHMAQQVMAMGGDVLCADTEVPWVVPNVPDGAHIGVRQYERLEDALRETIQSEDHGADGSPLVVFIDSFDLMMSHYDEMPFPAKTTSMLSDIQCTLAEIASDHAGTISVVLSCQHIPQTVVDLEERLKKAEWVRMAYPNVATLLRSSRIYTFPEFADATHTSKTTLDNWDKTGVLRAHRTVTGRRYYTHGQWLRVMERKGGKW